MEVTYTILQRYAQPGQLIRHFSHRREWIPAKDSKIIRWALEQRFVRLLIKSICLQQEFASSCDYCSIIVLEEKHLLFLSHCWLSSPICLTPNGPIMAGPIMAGLTCYVWLGNMWLWFPLSFWLCPVHLLVLYLSGPHVFSVATCPPSIWIQEASILTQSTGPSYLIS